MIVTFPVEFTDLNFVTIRHLLPKLVAEQKKDLANLEAEDATPSLRRRVGARIAELEEAVEERRRHADALAAQSAEAPPTIEDLTTALDRLPFLAERLQDLPQPELRALFNSLQLQIAFQPKTRTIDVEVTLVADAPDRDGETSQVWSVPRQESKLRTRFRRCYVKIAANRASSASSNSAR